MSRRVFRIGRIAALPLAVALMVVLANAVVFAAQPPSGAAQDGFMPVAPGELGQEQLPATPLVFAAYAFVWVALLVYVFSLWRRLTRVERELAEVATRARR